MCDFRPNKHMLRKLVLLTIFSITFISCEKKLKHYHWVKEKMSFLNLKFSNQSFIREVNYSHNEIVSHGKTIEGSEEGALIFEGFKLNYELVKEKALTEEIFDINYLHRYVDNIKVIDDQQCTNGYHKTVYYDVHGKEHDYVAHFVSKNSPVEILLSARCYTPQDYLTVEEIMENVSINETLLPQCL